jgi:hypothetical protein
MRRRSGGAIGAACLLLLAACGEPGREAPVAPIPAEAAAAPLDPFRFTDVTAESGIEFTPRSGGTPSTAILEVKGGGIALIDFDNDGLVDLFFPNGATLADPEAGPGARLYRNEGNLRFRDVTDESGIRHHRWSFGVAVGDFDGDGFDDLYIACFGPNVLLRNRGDGTFEEVTEAAGVGDPSWSTAAAFADLDGSGRLDLVVVNYLEFDPANPPPPAQFKGIPVLAGPRGLVPAIDRVYQNMGDGTFRDRTADSGIGAVPAAYGLNLAVVDFTGNGRPDIHVANDSMASHLFVNEGGFRFREEGLRSGVATNIEGAEQASMGIAIGDVLGNGRPDLFTTNFSSDTNTLHVNLDGRFFDDRTAAFGLAAPSRPLLGWGAGFFDLDHDGHEDLVFVNGHVYPQATIETMDSAYRQPPQLLRREGSRFVVQPSAGAWAMEPRVDRSIVFADLDGDGDIDLVISELNGPIRVIRNDLDPPPERWLRVRLDDRRPGIGNRRGVGAQITLERGDLVQHRWLWGGGPFQSNALAEAHFGLPPGAGDLRLRVRWPDGHLQTLDAIAPGEVLVVTRPE